MIVDGKELWDRLQSYSEFAGDTQGDIKQAIEDCQLLIKSPEQIERVIKFFKGIAQRDFYHRFTAGDVWHLLLYLNGKEKEQETWKDWDFEEEKDGS